MAYESEKPTKQKKQLYQFMERHKIRGTVSGRKLNKYVMEKGNIIRPAQLGKSSFQIINKKGNVLATGTAKKKRVDWWGVN